MSRSRAVDVLRVAGVLAVLLASAGIFLLQRDQPRLLVLPVPAWVVAAILAAALGLAAANALLMRGKLHAAAIAVLLVAAAGIRDIGPDSPWLAAVILGGLLAMELPSGAARLRDLQTGVLATASQQSRRDLRRYTAYYLAAAPAALAFISIITLSVLRLPQLVLGNLSDKYVESLEVRSVFFVVAVGWLLVAPLLGVRAVVGLRLHLHSTEAPRPSNPIATGASIVDEHSARPSDRPLIEVTS